jgi:hypothetical protein
MCIPKQHALCRTLPNAFNVLPVHKAHKAKSVQKDRPVQKECRAMLDNLGNLDRPENKDQREIQDHPANKANPDSLDNRERVPTTAHL